MPASVPHWPSRWGWALITAVVLIVYWPLSSFGYSLNSDDTLNCWLPWRWFIASCLQDGHLPLWNPYQQFGYPIYADLQGPAWYVEAIALGGTVGHGIHILQALFLAYVIVGGVGAMRFVRTVHGDPRAALVMGMAYALGGFFTGHQMHFYAVISAAWSPWAFDAVVRLLRTPHWRVALEAAVVHYLLLSGGNHTFMIIGAYVELALGLAFAWQAWRKGGLQRVMRLVPFTVLFILVTALMACGTLYAVQEVTPLMSRSQGLDLERAAHAPFTVSALRSLFLPYSIGTDPIQLGTDAPMANGYMGALVTVLALMAGLRKRSLVENVLLAAGLIAALAAFGPALPVHRWLWSYVPGMDLFRFPAYFRWFTWLAVVVLAGGSLRAWWAGELKGRTIAWWYWGWALLAIGVAFWSATFPWPGEPLTATWYERVTTLSPAARVRLCAPITIGVLVLLGFRAWHGRSGWIAVLALVVVEMGWNTTWAQWNTAVSAVPPSVYAHRLAQQSEGPVWPDPMPLSMHTDNGRGLHYLMHNVQDYLGHPTHSGYNSFWLGNATDLEVHHTALWSAMDQLPLVYLSDRAISSGDHERNTVDPREDITLVVMPEGVPPPNDLVRGDSDRVDVVAFEHDAIGLSTCTYGRTLLVLQQSHYPGWEVTVDDAPAELMQVNIAAMAVELPPGVHRVAFRFHKPMAGVLSLLSMCCLFIALIALAWFGDVRYVALGGVALLGVMVCWSLFGHRPKSERIPSGVAEVLSRIAHGDKVVVDTDRPAVLPIGGAVRAVRADDVQGVARAHGAFAGEAPDWWVEAGMSAHPTVRAWLKDRSRTVMTIERDGVVGVQLVPDTIPMQGRSLFLADPREVRGLHSADPYSPAVSIALDDVVDVRAGTLVVDLLGRSERTVELALVVERKNGARVTDYRTCPLVIPAGKDTEDWMPAYATVRMEELYRPGEELRMYLWHTGPDTIMVRDLRMRIVPEALDQW